MDLGITGKNALICGASSGIGKAISEALAAEGANVMLCARNDDALNAICQRLKAGNKQIKIESCRSDLTNESERNGLIEAAREKFGTIDILIHNTGGPKPTQAEDTSTAQWQYGFDSLFKSVVALNQAFIPDMKERRWGRILCVTSLSVMEPIAGLSVSNAIRSAVTAMLKTLADELASHNITVNCLAPGSIATGRIEELIEVRAKKAGISVEQYHKDYVRAIPAGRLGTPEEFAAVACFLSSQQASYVTGSTISIDGGRRRSTY